MQKVQFHSLVWCNTSALDFTILGRFLLSSISSEMLYISFTSLFHSSGHYNLLLCLFSPYITFHPHFTSLLLSPCIFLNIIFNRYVSFSQTVPHFLLIFLHHPSNPLQGSCSSSLHNIFNRNVFPFPHLTFLLLPQATRGSWLVDVTFLAVAVIGGLMVLLLPETKGLPLPNTISDLEKRKRQAKSNSGCEDGLRHNSYSYHRITEM